MLTATKYTCSFTHFSENQTAFSHAQVRSNALIKRGSLKMQNGQQVEALEDFATAIEDDPENSDIYHHRGQVWLLQLCICF